MQFKDRLKVKSKIKEKLNKFYLKIMSSNESEIWGKLTSVNNNLKSQNLSNNAYKIGRNSTNDIAISDVRISGTHCILSRDQNGTVILQDLSSNGTFLSDQKIGRGKSRILAAGDKFSLLPAAKVPEHELLAYVFTFNNLENNALKRDRSPQNEMIEESNKQIKPPGPPASNFVPTIEIYGKENKIQRYLQLMGKFTAE